MPQAPIRMSTALRASRLALVTVAALFGLTGIQKALTNHVPFGPATLVDDHGPLVDIWRNLREQMVADDARARLPSRARNDTKHVNSAPLSQRRMCAAFMMPGYAQRPGSAFHPRQLRDQSRAALPSKIGPEPLGLHTQSVLQLWKRHKMQEDPNEPSDESTHAKAPAL